jgi:hypothetical protein
MGTGIDEKREEEDSVNNNNQEDCALYTTLTN